MIKFIEYIKICAPLAFQIQQLKSKFNYIRPYSLYQIFKMIDKDLKGCIISQDLDKFCKFDKSQYTSQALIYLIDHKRQGKIKYRDLFQFFGCNQNQNNKKDSTNSRIIIQHLFKDILMKQLQYFYKCIHLRKRLQLYTFSDIYEIFQKMDSKHLQMLSNQCFVQFMYKHTKQQISQKYMNAFIKKQFITSIISLSQFFGFFQKCKIFVKIYQYIEKSRQIYQRNKKKNLPLTPVKDESKYQFKSHSTLRKLNNSRIYMYKTPSKQKNINKTPFTNYLSNKVQKQKSKNHNKTKKKTDAKTTKSSRRLKTTIDT